MLWIITFVLELLVGQPEICNSTIFGRPGKDRTTHLPAKYLKRPVDPDQDHIVAHRSLPMGSIVLITIGDRTRGYRTRIGVVADRGPYGMLLPSNVECPPHGRKRANGTCWINGARYYRKCNAVYRECRRAGRKGCIPPLHKSCYPPGARWNGGLDVAPALARELAHGGWERVTVRPVKYIRIPRSVLLQMWGGHGDV